VVSQHPVNVLIDGIGPSLNLLSYQDRPAFGFTADRDLMPDVRDLKNDLVAELDDTARQLGVTTDTGQQPGQDR
jgi:hypothetical protein